ncbi:MAG TPA: hypothetical protein VFO62_07700 [Candidatus Binatia bacterium]|nr:hypothetical protein [Candidatus Binatia bacterium]
MALAAIVVAILSIPAVFVVAPAIALALLAACVVTFVATGRASLGADPVRREVPAPQRSVAMSARVAIDEAVLAGQSFLVSRPPSAEIERTRRELDATRELFQRRGWSTDPAAYHRDPPPLTQPTLQVKRLRQGRRAIVYEELSFQSEYEPHADEPGRERWLGYAANRTGHAVVLRHAGEPRPWLVCIHGYFMGNTRFGLWLFDAFRLHRRLGINVILPVLPFHGSRKTGRFSGEGFLGGSVVDTVHAEAQSVWDLRRLLGWIRARRAPSIGVHGVSLGGYNAALLAGIDDDLSCVIAGVPPVDLARLVWTHAAPAVVGSLERAGIVRDEVTELYRVVSPLAFEPKIPVARRAIYAGIGDRLVSADHPRDLWEHWGRPRIVWTQGGHDPRTPEARRLVDDTLRASRIVG